MLSIYSRIINSRYSWRDKIGSKLDRSS